MSLSLEERKALRNKLLKDLYDYHFSNSSTKAKPIAEEIRDNEYKSAYLYLENKGYIEFENFGHPAFAGAKINAFGIDEVEKNM
ncbi:hypothetical protein NST63_18005 [Heyndrickxia sp. FSL W8-0496]|uniref:hypothetical protein n=1 Tax=Heyndrickxia sp. FSL W8-0496 TaxID=2954702 RepID=UPI0030FBBB03